MKFEMQHTVFGDVQTFTEVNPPSWMLKPPFYWWFKDYVLRLAVGGTTDSDFHTVRRVE